MLLMIVFLILFFFGICRAFYFLENGIYAVEDHFEEDSVTFFICKKKRFFLLGKTCKKTKLAFSNHDWKKFPFSCTYRWVDDGEKYNLRNAVREYNQNICNKTNSKFAIEKLENYIGKNNKHDQKNYRVKSMILECDFSSTEERIQNQMLNSKR